MCFVSVFLFLSDFDEVQTLLKGHNVKAWVNCRRRDMNFYRDRVRVGSIVRCRCFQLPFLVEFPPDIQLHRQFVVAGKGRDARKTSVRVEKEVLIS